MSPQKTFNSSAPVLKQVLILIPSIFVKYHKSSSLRVCVRPRLLLVQFACPRALPLPLTPISISLHAAVGLPKRPGLNGENLFFYN